MAEAQTLNPEDHSRAKLDTLAVDAGLPDVARYPSKPAVAEAINAMADYFFSDGPGVSAVIMALADAFYEAAIDQQTDE